MTKPPLREAALTPAEGPLAPDGAEGALPPAAPGDGLLLDRLLSGDRDAFTALVTGHHSALLRLALVFVGNRATAEEVVQETWVAVLDGLRRFERRSSLKTWIFRILGNRAQTRAVREGRSVPFSALGDTEEKWEPAVDPSRFDAAGMWTDPPNAWSDDTPEKIAMRAEAMACLERTVAELPANQRAVITLHDIEGLESEEVCNILGIRDTNQRVLLHRARSKVRHACEEFFRGK